MGIGGKSVQAEGSAEAIALGRSLLGVPEDSQRGGQWWVEGEEREWKV